MPVSPGPSKRYLLLLLTVSALLAILFVSSFRPQRAPFHQITNDKSATAPSHHVDALNINPDILSGAPIMPKLANETAKADLGRASWKLFHTIMSRFPDQPSPDERTALKSYIHLFVRLYPCGECAEHFRVIVEKFPPQTSSRSAAATWACHVHNEVNKSLGKAVFDCSKIGDFYDCGCAEDEGKEKAVGVGAVRSVEKPEMSIEDKEKMTGSAGREFNIDLITGDRLLKVEEGQE
ncbi:hypothetical protein LTR48_006652 [Friedmanniomyces endolithicus]|uniref:Sulfhydryl oxidase n=2 Tax=Dothideomycetidae TaxID=451867 RepID=A0A4U0VHE0_9PEZI|nr:hypothetical protein LTS09_002632 [Friedmanniomyces endolithicus]KAK1082937.1 hypothetical protein LTR48_006652 [Friedmanniomyces endolithicus]KAK5140617.1 hypothetical protein LTR32_006632 [Rachicladosporium monterosium]TKA48661.1 hypothetical protein B0A54_00797 [Friedmanniomyces endolithicus]